MDPLDGFYQQLDSERLLKQHGPELLADAREVLAASPEMRVAGLITLPDARDAESLRQALMATTGQDIPAGKLMVGLVPRALVEQVLSSMWGGTEWREESWQPQQVLAVVVSTKDGFRFGFFGLGDTGASAAGHE